ncbi:MAG: hypothetical protein JNJ83_24935 [Verrucomicrobiaceae bacterium]|nr:hypothetical protein [Verrucomicrobiaceae bacterium]
MDATVYALSFSLLPSQLSWATRDHSETPDTVSLIDMLRLQSVMSAPPGRRYPITRELWNTLHTSSNPVYRFIALEKFDSVEQTPAELLALYRECLFGACTYLEDRALEAIRSHNDFREEVANLLEEYLATNPPTNDGTFSGLRSAFDNPREGAKQVIEMIRNPDKWSSTTTHPPSKPKPTDGIEILSKSQAAKIFGSAPPTKDPVSDMTITPQSEEPTISTQLNWLGILIVIVTALGLLGWLIKRRP